MNCGKCGNEIRRGVESWREIRGWERRGKGAGSVILKQPTGRFVCSPCMHIERAPGGQHQTSILDSAV